MRRGLFGTMLLLHGLAHANAGMLAADGPKVLPSLLWAVASVAFLCAGFGLLGVRQLERHWQVFGLTGIASSLTMLVAYRPPTMVGGVAVDLAALAVLLFVWIPRREHTHEPAGRLARLAGAAAFAAIAYVAVVILARPWHSRWGSSDEELNAALPGDTLVPNAHYSIQHAVSIRATPEAIWPWLLQIGQDRGGFYSYDWLERLIGDDIWNADRIHPEWQSRAVGDLVRAAQPDYLGGIFGPDLGWRITVLERNRAIALDGWGTFVLQPDNESTRLIVRTRGDAKPNVLLAPFGLLAFEPAHFIMERRMLLGIKERVERQARRTPGM